MSVRFVFCLALTAFVTGCTVYESKGPDPNTREELTPICHTGGKTMRVPEEAVRAHLNHGDSLGECG